MAARELKETTKGAMLGLIWLVLRPFIQVAAYVIIVTFIFGARLGPDSSPYDYPLYVLSGMAVWQLVQRSLEEATVLIRDRTEVLKQVIYPLETLPLTSMLASMLGPGVGLFVYLCLAMVAGQLSWSVLLLPAALLLISMLVLGLAWLFMIVGVVLKDLREVVSVVMGLMIYFTPVLLSESMVGERLWSLILLNPFSHLIICFRDTLMGEFHIVSWVILTSLAIGSFLAGTWAVHRTKLIINEYI